MNKERLKRHREIAQATEIIEKLLNETTISDIRIISTQKYILDLFSINIEETNIPSGLENSPELYLENIDPFALNNSIFDFYQILKNLGDDITICDIGSANSLLSITANLFFPKVKIISIEPVASRMSEAIKLNEKLESNHEFYKMLFNEVTIEIRYDYALIYFPTGKTLENILSKIMNSSNAKMGIMAIESHGDLINRLNQNGCLSLDKTVSKLISPRHDPLVHLYQYNQQALRSKTDEVLEKLYDQEKSVIEIETNSKKWIGLTERSDVHFKQNQQFIINLKYPPRSVSSEDKFKFISIKEIDFETQVLLNLIKYPFSIIRKIYPNDKIFENSRGEIISY